MSTAPIVIIGAGPAGLMAAQQLAEKGFEVHIYEQNKAAARKFLVAGHGGFNLTHNEPIEQFILRYDNPILHKIVKHFDNQDTINWLKDLGIETYVGSSGKIFPVKNIKPIQVLQAWLDKLEQLGVKIFYQHTFIDFDYHQVTVSYNESIQKVTYNKLILALGGGSWKKTGSDAKWIPLFESKGIAISPLQSANSGYETTESFSELEGQVLKNIEVKFENITKKGELVFTQYGIEGSSIYYLNRFTRKTPFPLQIQVDLKPNLSDAQIESELNKSNNITKTLKEKLNFAGASLQLLKKLPKEIYVNPTSLSKAIKQYPIEVANLRPIDEVISTAGGVSFDGVNESLALYKHPNVYCLGEMLDWEAPTGGYLLQACFSMGAWAADNIIE